MIDFHTHVFPDKIAAATVAALAKVSNTAPHSGGTADELLSLLSDAGADVAVNLPVLTKPTQFDSILNYAVALNGREYGKERIISFAGIHPADETQVQSLGQEDPLEEEMATHFGIVAWKIPWTEKPGGLQSRGSKTIRHD